LLSDVLQGRQRAHLARRSCLAHALKYAKRRR
jgi:hypothetical protein